MEESSEGSSDEEMQIYESRSKIPISDNMKRAKSVSRSSSGVGTSSHQSSKKRDGTDETSSRCFSPSLKNNMIEEEGFSDDNKETPVNNVRTEVKRKITPMPDNKYSTLRSLKNTLTKNKSRSKFDLFSSKGKKKESEVDKYELAQKTPILDKYDPNTLQENDDEDFGSFTEEDGSFSMSEVEENGDQNDQYSKIIKRRGQKLESNSIKEKSRSSTQLYHNSHHAKERDLQNNALTHTQSNSQYLKKYRGNIVYSSEDDSELDSNDEEKTAKERKYSNQLKECSDYSSKDELLTDKPAMNTLKKTFTSMLSKMPFARSRADSSSISDNCSVRSKSSKAWDTASTIDRSVFRSGDRNKRAKNLARANSSASVNIKNSGIYI